MTEYLLSNIKQWLQKNPIWRIYFAFAVLLFSVGIISKELFILQLPFLKIEQENRKGAEQLQKKGNESSVRHEKIDAHRGIIFDRSGAPLAVSVAMTSLTFDGTRVDPLDQKWQLVAKNLNLKSISLNSKKEFNYIVRRIYPKHAQQLLELKIKGLDKKIEYKRFYPKANLAAPLLGLANIDDIGIDGAEYAYNSYLIGKPGTRRIVKNIGKNYRILDEKIVDAPSSGKDLVLSLDLRLQYIAERELAAAIAERNAKAGIILIADVQTGELLAVANNPTYNPNNLNTSKDKDRRNLALVDVFEIGSTAKPFSMLAALQSGKWKVNDTVDVWPFKLELKGQEKPIYDVTRNNGHILDLTKILINSSNVGMSKVAFKIGGEPIYRMLQKVGLGQTLLGFTGERLGLLPYHKNWPQAETATLSFGYGVSVNAVQLLQAYNVIATDGVMLPLTLLPRTKENIKQDAQQVLEPSLVRQVKQMLQKVVENPKGAYLAQVPNYTVAGKSGTARKHIGRGYSKEKHSSIFVGFAPVQKPRYSVLVFIDEPQGEYFGGKVAAPVFSKVMNETLRLMNVRPDKLQVAKK